MINTGSIDSIWRCLIQDLLSRGCRVDAESRDGNVRGEMIGWRCALDASKQDFILRNERRNLSHAYVSAETLWYLSGTDDVAMLKRYAPSYERFAEDGKAYGAYGPRVMPQIPNVIDKLKSSKLSRQAVVAIWEARDLRKVGPDIPCTLSHQYLIRSGQLHLVVTMRSNDAWLGFPNDVAAFCMMQRLVAACCGVRPGMYYHQVGSMHLYERNAEDAGECLSAGSYRNIETWALDDTFTTMEKAVECERTMRIEGVRPPAYEVLGDMGKWMIDSIAKRLKLVKQKAAPDEEADLHQS